MPEPAHVHRATSALLSAAMAVLGVLMLAITLVRGGGPLTTGVLLGVLFLLAGGGRLYLTLRGG